MLVGGTGTYPPSIDVCHGYERTGVGGLSLRADLKIE